MLTVFRNIKKYCQDLIYPYVAHLKNTIDQNFKYLNLKLSETYDRLNLLLSQLRAFLTQVVSNISARINTIDSINLSTFNDLNTEVLDHIRDYDNPHNLTASKLATVSAVQPDPAQGVVGDTWFEYEPNYTVVG